MDKKYIKLQIRRGTSEIWNPIAEGSEVPTVDVGEIVLNTDTEELKIGTAAL